MLFRTPRPWRGWSVGIALLLGYSSLAWAQEASESRARIIRTDVPPAPNTTDSLADRLGISELPQLDPASRHNESGTARIHLDRSPRAGRPTYFDPSISPMRYQESDDHLALPKIIYGPPPPITVDPAFNGPGGERLDEVRSARARLSRSIPVRVPSYFDLPPESPRLPDADETTSARQDIMSEPAEFAVPPPPTVGGGLRLLDESSSMPTLENGDAAHRPGWTTEELPRPTGRFGPRNVPNLWEELPLWDRFSRETPGPVDTDQGTQSADCQLNCYVGCSPLFYSTIWGGYQTMRDLRTWPEDPLTPRGIFQLDDGLAAGVGLGIYHGPNLRGDLELSLRSNPLAALSVQRTVGLPLEETFLLDGHLKSYAGMSNVYWDFPHFPLKRVKPYVGLGIGFVFFDPDVHRVGQRILDPLFDRDSSFAYQWMAGLNAPLNDQFDFFCEFRFFAADSFRMHADLQSLSGSGLDPASLPGNFDYRSKNILMGLRYKF